MENPILYHLHEIIDHEQATNQQKHKINSLMDSRSKSYLLSSSSRSFSTLLISVLTPTGEGFGPGKSSCY
ncbi:hypothetical protein Hanom_Chr15g01362771 [Helianthus anomalus]